MVGEKKENYTSLFREAFNLFVKRPKVLEALGCFGKVLQFATIEVEAAKVYVDTRQGVQCFEGSFPNPDAKIYCSQETWERLMSDDMSLMKAFILKKIRVEGPAAKEAMTLGSMINDLQAAYKDVTSAH